MENTTTNTVQKILTLLGVGIATAILLGSCSMKGKEEFQAPLFDNMGNYWVETSTTSRDANRFFVQGLLMAYGFNHAESARSFREAIRLDSTYAMAYWGLAYVLGPNYNLGMSDEDRSEVLWAVDQAQDYSKEAMKWEKALIDVLVIKFPKDVTEPKEEEYARAMIDLIPAFYENPDVLSFIAEAQMNIHAWDLYETKGGAPRSWTPEIVLLLERALQIDGNHPLANHLYIHATEASSKPETGYAAAEKLSKIVPGSGHLVHMPSHTYINTGDYHLGSLANEQAVIVDSTYVAQCKQQGAYPQLYYPHNYHFLAACTALEGRGIRSIQASFKMADIIDDTYLGKEGYETTQHFLTTPYNVLVKFAQWEKLLALPEPDESYPYLTAVWRYGRGMALANKGRLLSAYEELEKMKVIQKSGNLKDILIFEINSAQDVVDIAVHVLTAEIADKQQNCDHAVNHLQNAIEIEDNLSYNEPPDWFFSVRHILGDLYLRLERYEEAEEIYKEDLATFPKNGFALNGLYHSLRSQGRMQEAGEVVSQFRKAWQYADTKLKYSRIDESSRVDYELAMERDTPDQLIYLATNFCGF